jgi:hypothetical protein
MHMSNDLTSRLQRLGAVLAVTLGAALSLAAATTHTAVARASEPCPNEALRVESNVNPVTGRPYSVGLPDCRAYELVSSGDKNDVDAMLSPISSNGHSSSYNFGLVSEDGDRVLWGKEVEPYSEPNDGASDVYEATRDSSGWSQSLALVPTGTGSSEGLFIAAASSDLSTVLLRSTPTEVPSTAGSYQLIERGVDGSYASVASVSGSYAEPFAQLSGDGSHVFFQTEAQLAGDTHIAGRQVYEWTSAAGVRVVGVNDAGNPVSSCGAVLAGEKGTFPGLSYPDVSQDSSRVLLQSPDPEGFGDLRALSTAGKITGAELAAEEPVCKRPPELYMRENGSSTVEISKAPPGAGECEPGVTECEAAFVGATPDGSKVFFVTSSQLTPDKANTGLDLYEYNVETSVLKRLSVGPPGYDDAEVGEPYHGVEVRERQELAIVSADGSHVYFTGFGQLVPGEGATAATNHADQTVNLYMYADGSVSFIATVGPGDQPDDNTRRGPPLASPLGIDQAEVTPDGSDLVFDSDSQLTAYDNAGRSELYRYAAPSRTISCISCSPAFAAPNGPLDPVFHTSFADDPYGTVQQFGGLSDDGQTIFFASTDQLLPAATNVLAAEPESPVYDVYEWHDGVLSLISSGTSPSSDFLLGASPSGSDVFFVSADQLVPRDGEHSYEIYDAHVEGGFPAPATPAPCTSAETCRSMAATPPTTLSPATVSISSPGDEATVTESGTPPPQAKVKAESRSEKLSKALKACKKLKGSKRKPCERTAHKNYGPASSKKGKKT